METKIDNENKENMKICDEVKIEIEKRAAIVHNHHREMCIIYI